MVPVVPGAGAAALASAGVWGGATVAIVPGCASIARSAPCADTPAQIRKPMQATASSRACLWLTRRAITRARIAQIRPDDAARDRKRVVSGKSGSVRVERGGRRRYKKKK